MDNTDTPRSGNSMLGDIDPAPEPDTSGDEPPVHEHLIDEPPGDADVRGRDQNREENEEQNDDQER